MSSGPLAAWMNPLPLELTPALRDRRRSVAAGARGRVLDLGGWTDHLDAYGDVDVDLIVVPGRGRGSGDGEVGDGRGRIRRVAATLEALPDLDRGPYDTIVSLIRTPLIPDLARHLVGLRARLNPDGHLVLLEPDRRPDRVGRLLTAFSPLVRSTAGLHLDRDVTGAVRSAGFQITDLHRFSVLSVAAPLRPFIEAHARLTPARS